MERHGRHTISSSGRNRCEKDIFLDCTLLFLDLRLKRDRILNINERCRKHAFSTIFFLFRLLYVVQEWKNVKIVPIERYRRMITI